MIEPKRLCRACFNKRPLHRTWLDKLLGLPGDRGALFYAFPHGGNCAECKIPLTSRDAVAVRA